MAGGTASAIKAQVCRLHRPLLGLGGLFLLLWSLHYLARRFLASHWDTPLEGFPVSVLAPNLSLAGLPAVAAFCLLAWWAAERAERLGGSGLWLVALALLLLGNLGQGGFAAGFLDPLLAGDLQYAADAAAIADWRAWLAGFNESQPTLGVHARFHPPFAVLALGLLLDLFNPAGAALAVTLLASLTPPLSRAILRRLTAPAAAAQSALLLALLPAFNIYGAVSLDAVVLLSATLFLWGLVAWPSEGGSAAAFAALVAGLLVCSLLTFLSTLPLAAGVLFALATRRLRLLAALVAATLLVVLVLAALVPLAGYDHWQAFRTAEALHNPAGWWFLSQPDLYLATRVECLLESLLFLSFPLAAALLVARPWRRWRQPGPAALLAMLAVYGLFLFAGGAHTGETARTLLFLYPWLLLALANRDADPPGRGLLALVALQTAAMQFVGGYLW